MTLKPTKVEYKLADVFSALTGIVAERMTAVADIPESYGTNQPALALESAQKAMSKVKGWQRREVTDLVAQFAVPENDNLAGEPGHDLVSQINNRTMRPKGVTLE